MMSWVCEDQRYCMVAAKITLQSRYHESELQEDPTMDIKSY